MRAGADVAASYRMLQRIISGGQTGADRAGLDFALTHGLGVGGWVPCGRLAEDGPIPERYPGLIETKSTDPAVRTALNVSDSDATLILSHGPLSGGALLTLQEATRAGKPALHLDFAQLTPLLAAERLRRWLSAVRPSVLNVAGPRASEDPNIAAATAEVLGQCLNAD